MGGKSGKVAANREYKDTVFTRLFRDKAKLAELYNAIAGTSYTADDVTIVTLDNVIFVGRENDIAFTIGDRLVVLIEHQSTINPNMPLRCLLYIAREYQRLADGEAIYSSRLVHIASPEFIVMYNGVDDYPEVAELRLSDAFRGEKGNLELKVKVYNVNKGHNEAMMRRSRTLGEYAAFVACARENIENGLSLEESLKKAVRDCVNGDILKDFLKNYGSDVINMLSMEFNLEDALRVREKDGIIKGAEKIAEKMLKRGTPIEYVSEDTELSIERVKEIAKKIKS